MSEDFLHYIWKHSLLPVDLTTTAGEAITLLKQGTHQTDAGPDFFNAQVKIGDTKWAGNVEIHVNSSDWYKHGHDSDEAYQKIILHVVYNNDTTVEINGKPVPTLELKKIIDTSIYSCYQDMVNNSHWIPCEKLIGQVDEFIVNTWLDRMLVERLERKTKEIERILLLTKNDWAETFYVFLARSFGFKVNALPFELLARSLPQKYLGKHKNNLMQIEALLFGQAGFLEQDFTDDYSSQLKKEYTFLQQKFGLQPIDNHLWKFLRLRPANFPTIRIAQFAQLIHHQSNLFDFFLNAQPQQMEKVFKVEASEYWSTHYTFEKVSKAKPKSMGISSIQTLLINTVVPFLFLYGKHKKQGKYTQQAFTLLESLPTESNSIIKKWEALNISANNAYASQALLELKNEYCTAKKCLSCNIGNRILQP